MTIKPLRTRLFKEGEDLLSFINQHVPRLREGSVLAVTSKIVALSERRTTEIKNKKEMERLVRAESELALPTKYVWMTIKDGMVMASAGIDESNANGKLILLPHDSFRAAQQLRTALRKHHRIKKLGIIITDSRIMPLCAGVVGVALGYAGFCGLKDYRGTPDLFGRRFRFASTDVADSLATAAVFLMGEGREQQPLAVITEAPITFRDRIERNELRINPRDDIYRPFFKGLR